MAQSVDRFTEHFAGDGDNIDLANTTLTLKIFDSDALYEACIEKGVTEFPVDPSGHAPVSLGNDDFVDTSTFPGGKTFIFYSIRYDKVFIGSNGYVTFAGGETGSDSTFANHFLAPRVSALFKDLDPGAGGSVSWTALQDSLVVTFVDVPDRGSADLNSFQIELFFDGSDSAGTVRITWLSVGSAPGIAGVSNGNGLPDPFEESNLDAYPACGSIVLSATPTSGLISQGTTTLPDSFTPTSVAYTLRNRDSATALAWTSSTSENYVSVTPPSGSIPPSGTLTVNIAIDPDKAKDLPIGSNFASVTFTPTVGVAVQRSVTVTVNDTNIVTQFFTEHFSDNDFDLANTTLTFAPRSVPEFYLGCRDTQVTSFPTDPSGGTERVLADDDFYRLFLSTGNRVSLFGVSYDAINFSSNGLITFGEGATAFTESTQEHFARPTISALFRDFNPPSIATIRWQELADRVVVTYSNMPEVLRSNPNESHPTNSSSFQVELFFDGGPDAGKIRLTWLQVDAGNGLVGLSAGMGIPTGFNESDLSQLKLTPTGPFDWGDAPDTAAGTGTGNYQTTEADNGPKHQIVADLYLGQAPPDADDGGQGSSDAQGDDTDADGDDEDAVQNASDLTIFEGEVAPTVRISSTNNQSVDAKLNGWIDYDGDGLFENSFEKASLTIPANSGSNEYSLTFPNVPSSAVVDTQGTSFLRLRISTDQAAGDAIDFANDGEVEDHRVTVAEYPVVSFTSSAQTVSESAGVLTVEALLDKPAIVDVLLPFSIAGNAMEGGTADFTVSASPLTIPSGQTSGSISFSILDDLLDEDDEQIVMNLGSPTNATLNSGKKAHTIIITDNDEPVSIEIADRFGNEAVGSMNFTVSLSKASGRTVQVSYSTAVGTADGADFTATAATLVFAPGETSKIIAVPITNDSRDEDDQSFSVTLASPSFATLARASAIGTIVDDDPRPTLTIDSPRVREDAGNMPFALKLSAPSEKAISVTYATTDGTATSPADFTAANGTRNIAPGASSDTLNVALVADKLFESDEQFTLTLSAPVNVTLGGSPATGTIVPASNISTARKTAWSPTTGWINWRTDPLAGAHVALSAVGGFIWNATTGWVNLGNSKPANGISYSNSTASDFGLNRDSAGNLTGNAWASSTGWIVFEQRYGKPKIDPTSGAFSGYAWSATCGWINLGGLSMTRFDIIDSDGDSLDDSWELNHFKNLAASNGTIDTDNDGISDLNEYLSGTDPKSIEDYLRIGSYTSSGANEELTNFTLTFPSKQSFVYKIEISNDLAAWRDSGLGTFPSSSGETTTKEIALQSDTVKVFFRVLGGAALGR